MKRLILLWLVGALASTVAPMFAAEISANSWNGDGGVSDFYVWTGAIPHASGRMVRSEPLPEKLALQNAGRSLRILYTSIDGLDGKTPVIVSGALFLPKSDSPKGGWPLLAWAHGTVGVADVCAPSWAGRSTRDITYLNHWLAQGYAVVASDYQGLGTPGAHPYLATRPAAYSVLDGIRAVQRAEKGLSKKVVLIGQSQGGAAAFATAGFAKSYAPELDIRGTVATGTPYFSPEVQIQQLATRPRDVVEPTLAYRLLMLYLLKETNPNFQFEDHVTEAALPSVRLGATGCLRQIEESAMQQKLTINSAFKTDPLPLFTKAYELMGYPTLKINRPVFIGTGGRDRDVPLPMQSSLVKDACAAKTRVEWHVYPELDHSGTVNASLADSTPFVRRILAGETVPGNCGLVAPSESR